MTRLFEAKPYIICEVGSNWRTLGDCLESIRVAAECGASAAKFQLFSHGALYGFCDATDSYSLPLEWLPTLRAKAEEVGIEFGCTAFSPELVAAVDPYVHWHKVASSDAAWPQLLDAVASCNKPVILSTGAKTDDEVKRASHMLSLKVPLIRMVCVAAYPADYVDPTPFAIGARGIGLSDHTLGYTLPVFAARCGAQVIEKHFTAFPDLDTPDLDTPDRPHSLTPTQFKRMVDIIRGREVESEEKEMYTKHNRRLIATRDIAPGEVMKYGENYGAYRSLHDDIRGASPFDWEQVEGRVSKVATARGGGIRVGDVE